MARDERLQRDVAVKILARELVSDGRFEREARAAARLSHPGIVTLYEAVVDDDGAYLVSELVDGATLDRLLADGSVSDRDILRIGLALCDALDHAHGQGVVHRDVKPSNVLVPAKRADDRPPARGQAAKLTDFGVARVIDSDSLTLTGDVIGTLNYMSPEQAAGLEASEPADLYSLAVVLYEALTGINPLRSNGTLVARRARPSMLPPLRRQRRDLPASLGDAIDRALRPQPADRGTISDLRLGLERSIPQVGDEPGVVTDWTLRRAPADGETEPLFWARLPGTAVQDRPQPADRADARRERGGEPPSGGRLGPPRRRAADPDRLFWQHRGLAAACAAGTTAWIGAHVLDPGAAAAAAARPAGGVRDAASARLGWLATVAFACATTAIQGHDGLALVLAIVAAVPIVAMPVTPTAWPLAAAAPALGLVGPAGLAGAWPALAGLARTPWRRVALAVSGWVWLLAAGAVGALHGRFAARPLRAQAARAETQRLERLARRHRASPVPVVCPHRRAPRRRRMGAGGAARAVSDPRPLGDRRRRPGAALVGRHGRGDGGRDHAHHDRSQRHDQARLPTTSAEIVGADRRRGGPADLVDRPVAAARPGGAGIHRPGSVT